MFAKAVFITAFATLALSAVVPEKRDNVVWTISGPKDAVKALGSPAEALESMSKDMKAKTKVEPAAAAQPIVETRDKADDLLMYYNE